MTVERVVWRNNGKIEILYTGHNDINPEYLVK